jgi:hypothetical protein
MTVASVFKWLISKTSKPEFYGTECAFVLVSDQRPCETSKEYAKRDHEARFIALAIKKLSAQCTFQTSPG